MEIKIKSVEMGLDKYDMPGEIRLAKEEDISRIAEIIVLAKRMVWRNIYKHDEWIFQDLQVLPVCMDLEKNPEKLENIYVYSEGFVQGIVCMDGQEVKGIFVDPFFQIQGVGDKLLDYVKEFKDAQCLWVKEKNEMAIHFFKRHGFASSGETRLEEKTNEPMIKMVR
ncbi:MAG: GNAT family N-acetyltransferase [Lachnospiraceae bacterium]|nr:GNAT family N-acetyltransferase [Lachnospiraceae bacterium]